ncbi:MAG TPA: 50S ribosomal protein L25/general stress protein Ctc [Alphaproteobacteria bacterium]
MVETVTISAQSRQRAGKGAARAVRRAGRIPGVIYGDKQAPTLIALDPKDLVREFQKPGFFTRVFDVQIDGRSERVLPRDVQLHPVTDRPEHVDFQRVGAKTQIRVSVPVRFENQERSPGLKRGGVLNVVRHEIEVYCSIENIPQVITVNLEGLDIGDSVHISAVKLPEGVRPTITTRDFTIAAVAAPSVLRGAEEGGAAAAGAPAEAGAAAPAPQAAAGGAAKASAAGEKKAAGKK